MPHITDADRRLIGDYLDPECKLTDLCETHGCTLRELSAKLRDPHILEMIETIATLSETRANHLQRTHADRAVCTLIEVSQDLNASPETRRRAASKRPSQREGPGVGFFQFLSEDSLQSHRTTKRSPDHTSEIAHTFLSTSPVERPNARTTLSERSVRTMTSSGRAPSNPSMSMSASMNAARCPGLIPNFFAVGVPEYPADAFVCSDGKRSGAVRSVCHWPQDATRYKQRIRTRGDRRS